LLFADARSPGIPARPPVAHPKPRRTARSPVAQPFRQLITPQQMAPRHRHRCWSVVVVAWASARVVHRVQALPGDPSAEADGCLCLRLSGCDHPETEAVSRGVFTNPTRLQPAVKLVLFR
jgi:hypothetical protein